MNSCRHCWNLDEEIQQLQDQVSAPTILTSRMIEQISAEAALAEKEHALEEAFERWRDAGSNAGRELIPPVIFGEITETVCAHHST